MAPLRACLILKYPHCSSMPSAYASRLFLPAPAGTACDTRKSTYLAAIPRNRLSARHDSINLYIQVTRGQTPTKQRVTERVKRDSDTATKSTTVNCRQLSRSAFALRELHPCTHTPHTRRGPPLRHRNSTHTKTQQSQTRADNR